MRIYARIYRPYKAKSPKLFNYIFFWFRQKHNVMFNIKHILRFHAFPLKPK